MSLFNFLVNSHALTHAACFFTPPPFHKVFIIETVGGRTYYLSASSRDTMESWVNKLRRVYLEDLIRNCNDEDGRKASRAWTDLSESFN